VHSDPLYQYKAFLSETAFGAKTLGEQRENAAQYVAELSRPPVDVQAAVTVLGRLPLREGVSRGDLDGANLTKANLTKANLIGANLTGASSSRRT
jgi:uncharacterized protein YjbI with pentapeptide repeats